MRIGIDARLWNQTGVGRYIRNLIINLQKIDNKNEYVIFVRTEDLGNVKKVIKNKKFKAIISNVMWHSLKEQTEFVGVLNKENLDLVHFPYFSAPIFYKKPFVVTIHDLIMHHYPTGRASTLPLPLYSIKKMGYNFVINSAVKNAQKIIVPLNAVKEDLIKSLKVPPDKIVVTYEGVDATISNSTLPKSEYEDYFLYVGNAYPHKNLDKLIEGFKNFRNIQKDVKLLLVGKDDFFYKRLEENINDESVIFLHNVSDEELSSLYKNAIALISVSLMEGFGLPAIEATSNNCLVMLSDIPSFKEVMGETAVYFNPNDASDIAEKMQGVFKNGKDYYLEQILKAKERLKLFSWEKMSKQTLKIYESSNSLRQS